MLTSATTFASVLILWIFGGLALRDFSFTIMIGVLVGTYSSIYIASPIVYMWTKMRGGNLRRELGMPQLPHGAPGRCRGIRAKQALDHIAGYMIFNDFSSRDYQIAEMAGTHIPTPIPKKAMPTASTAKVSKLATNKAPISIESSPRPMN